jgi:UDP-N-acetylglucosamine diphosphorylase / glucose-1-phosphate thymidylyltransferase / UDP-N-acetylgalactosamine diphosphorylase / glucosamine-1-phosphate N-acetyltransferase / galactosamine-1-phosphate N-acetyltransferase
MKTLLIFAGQSTRFWPLKDKCFAKVGGKTILEHQVDRLRSAGLKDILLVGGKHNLSRAKKLFPELKAVEQKDPSLGMREAFVSALPRCGKEPVMLVNSNDVLDADAYKLMLQRFKASKADGFLLARKVQAYFPGGYLTLRQAQGKPSNVIKSIVEKPGKGNEPSKLVNIVAHIHRDPTRLLQLLKEIRTTKDDGYEQALDILFGEKTYEAVAYEGVWQAIKYPWHLLQLLPILLSGQKRSIHKTAQIHTSAVVDGDVVLAKGVKVMAHATIVGPCMIGEGTIVANNALVRGSSVGDRCVIGYNTEIVRSVIGNDVWTHSSYVGDSVVGDNVSFGAGTTTGNLRLDEGEISSSVKNEPVGTGLSKLGAVIGDHCRTGIHSCISPGVKIGSSSFIGSNILVTHDIPDQSFVKQKNIELEIRPNTRQATSPEDRGSFRSLLTAPKKRN